MTLTEFLLARISEVEAEALRLQDLEPVWIVYGADNFAADYHPARVLAECKAKREILHLHRSVGAGGAGSWSPSGWCEECWESDGAYGGKHPAFPCMTLRELTLPYAEHPDYRPEWRPGA